MVPEGLGMSTDGFHPSMLADVINVAVVLVGLSYATAIFCPPEEGQTVPQKKRRRVDGKREFLWEFPTWI